MQATSLRENAPLEKRVRLARRSCPAISLCIDAKVQWIQNDRLQRVRVFCGRATLFKQRLDLCERPRHESYFSSLRCPLRYAAVVLCGGGIRLSDLTDSVDRRRNHGGGIKFSNKLTLGRRSGNARVSHSAPASVLASDNLGPARNCESCHSEQMKRPAISVIRPKRVTYVALVPGDRESSFRINSILTEKACREKFTRR